MIKVGLTGGIGSGKTTVAKIFKLLGVPVYFSDDRAKYLMLNNEFLRQSLISLFGDKVIDNGVLNRSFIASKVFTNPKELIKLNDLVHPFIFKDFDLWSSSQNSNYVLKEAAIIFETGADKLIDLIRNRGGLSKGAIEVINQCYAKCHVCRKHSKRQPRPKVGLPKASEANEVVSLDLKNVSSLIKKPTDKRYIFYMTDEF